MKASLILIPLLTNFLATAKAEEPAAEPVAAAQSPEEAVRGWVKRVSEAATPEERVAAIDGLIKPLWAAKDEAVVDEALRELSLDMQEDDARVRAAATTVFGAVARQKGYSVQAAPFVIQYLGSETDNAGQSRGVNALGPLLADPKMPENTLKVGAQLLGRAMLFDDNAATRRQAAGYLWDLGPRAAAARKYLDLAFERDPILEIRVLAAGTLTRLDAKPDTTGVIEQLRPYFRRNWIEAMVGLQYLEKLAEAGDEKAIQELVRLVVVGNDPNVRAWAAIAFKDGICAKAGPYLTDLEAAARLEKLPGVQRDIQAAVERIRAAQPK